MTDVIQLGEYQFNNKRRRRLSGSECRHKRMTIDDHGDVITCDDCGKQLSAAWVLREVLADYERELEKINARVAALHEQTSRNIHLLAARKVETAWRSQTLVPACPHCSRGILATDGFGSTLINKKMELRRRESEATPGKS